MSYYSQNQQPSSYPTPSYPAGNTNNNHNNHNHSTVVAKCSTCNVCDSYNGQPGNSCCRSCRDGYHCTSRTHVYNGSSSHHQHHHSSPSSHQSYHQSGSSKAHNNNNNNNHHQPSSHSHSSHDSSTSSSSSSFNPIFVPYHTSTTYEAGKVKALFIGTNYTGQSCELDGCVNDIQTMMETLKRITFPIDEAVVLADPDPQKQAKFPYPYLAPTKKNILGYLHWLVKDIEAGDTLFLHLSGHGIQVKDLDGDESDGFDEAYLPVDHDGGKNYILDDDIFDIVVRRLPPGTRLSCVLDCCHSETLLDLPFTFVADRDDASYYSSNFGKNLYKQENNKITGGGDVVAFSGCSDAGTSADTSGGANFNTPLAKTDPRRAGGAATNALSQVLTTTAGLTYSEILMQMREKLKERGFKQVPSLTCTKPIDIRKKFSLFQGFDQISFSMPTTVAPPPVWQLPPVPTQQFSMFPIHVQKYQRQYVPGVMMQMIPKFNSPQMMMQQPQYQQQQQQPQPQYQQQQQKYQSGYPSNAV